MRVMLRTEVIHLTTGVITDAFPFNICAENMSHGSNGAIFSIPRIMRRFASAGHSFLGGCRHAIFIL